MMKNFSRQIHLIQGRFLLLIVWALFLLYSCSSVKPAKPAPGPTIPAKEPPAGQADAARPDPAVAEPEDRGAEKKEDAGRTGKRLTSYNVVFFLPFLTSRPDVSPSVSKWSQNFYAGARMALDELQEKDVHLDVSTIDSKATEEEVAQILQNNPDLASAHLIIGPYRRNNIQQVAEFIRNREAVQVSPYSAVSGLTKNNPRFIQVRPTMETHSAALVGHALERYSRNNIILVGKSAEPRSLEAFQQAYFKWAGSRSAPPLTEFFTAAASTMKVSPLLAGRDTAVFIVSAWSSEDERFVYSLLRNLQLARRPGQYIAVYGTPVWAEFERVELDDYEKLDVHISNHQFLDGADPEVRNFRRRFYDRYGSLPPEEAFLGYDVTLYFGTLLSRYGPGFYQELEREPSKGIHTRFDFERVVSAGAAEQNPPVDMYENKFVYILRFHDYKFQPD